MYITGASELPLHSGHVPPYLLQYMKRLGKAIAMYILDEFGPTTLVKRLSDPLWFQAFNNVIGMDWDSSGSTTVVLYVLKDFANVNTFKDIGFAILGGKGIDSRQISEELKALERYSNLDIDRLSYSSRLSAKIDGVALQDGYTLYIHGMAISEDSTWTIIQQGMNINIKQARRYHIYSSNIITAENDPHSGIACNNVGVALNLIDRESHRARKTIIDIVNDDVHSVIREIAEINRMLRRNSTLTKWINKEHSISTNKRYIDPNKNPLFYRPITNLSRIENILRHIASIEPKNFDELLLMRNVGPETIRALALVADIIYSDTPSFRDPVTHAIDPFIYAYAHGGKDGIPYPIKINVMKESIEFLERAIIEAKIDDKTKKDSLKRLHRLWKDILNSIIHEKDFKDQ
ncbi:protein of unknown function DUF763 [Ignisphaera aggregans DSM 17230]|uniref:DUF763 domain-containing protein n=1 Tax=Ignisphaera aggregans (strain DSM 17230 / JCM 13409 / AQ1.S1) TaxID=583356 RepID=E0SSN2_IGNAA|nr:protein of unknown function DUF763 [Ignisphaera aggregans DSM 17230]